MNARIIARLFDSSGDAEPSVGLVDLGNGVGAIATVALLPTIATVTSSATPQQLLAANPLRIGARLLNDASTVLHVVENQATTTYGAQGRTEVLVPPGAGYGATEGYFGVIEGFWEGAPTGNAIVTEFTLKTT